MRPRQPLIIGRYALYDEVASGGMASVYLGRLLGPVGFSRTVAIKRMHPHYATEAEFVAMFIDEARLAARIRHPNVVQTLDVVRTDDELFLVMDYLHGESLSRLMKAAWAKGPIAPRIALPILAGALHGLEAAHTATSETGAPLEIVHRDVSPQNVMVGADGIARVFDFGIAKAKNRLHTTRDGSVKGKLAYMAPEQLTGKVVTCQADVYAAAVVLWEALAGRRLFDAEHEAQIMHQVLDGVSVPPSAHNPEVSKELDAIVMRALSRDPSVRYRSAKAIAHALEELGGHATPSVVGAWVAEHSGPALARRAVRLREIESEGESERIAGSTAQSASVPLLGPPVEGGSAPQRESGTFTSNTRNTMAGVPERRGLLAGPRLPIALTGLLLGLGALAYFALREPALASDAPTAGTPATGSAHASLASVVTTASSLADAAHSADTPLVTPAPSTTAAASSSALVAPTVRSATARPPTALGPPKAAPAANTCSPPYYFDTDGIKHPKPGCL